MSLQALWVSEGYSAVMANGRAGTRPKIQQLKHLAAGPGTWMTTVRNSSNL